jgi:hypothetical protein
MLNGPANWLAAALRGQAAEPPANAAGSEREEYWEDSPIRAPEPPPRRLCATREAPDLLDGGRLSSGPGGQ